VLSASAARESEQSMKTGIDTEPWSSGHWSNDPASSLCSAAFDTVDHDILLTWLKVSFGIGGAALDWLQSYLTSRVECVRHGSARSTHKTVRFGVPQRSLIKWSCLLAVLFVSGCGATDRSYTRWNKVAFWLLTHFICQMGAAFTCMWDIAQHPGSAIS